MNNRELFQDTFSKVTLSEEKRKELIDMRYLRRPKRKFHITKAAAAAILCCLLLAGGTVTYAISHKVFNRLGYSFDYIVVKNGELEDAQVTEEPNGDFTIRYGTEDDNFETQINGLEDTTSLFLDFEYEDPKGIYETCSESTELRIDKTQSYESQLWDIREQMFFTSSHAFSKGTLGDSYMSAVRKAAGKVEGVWKEGLLLAIDDIQKLLNGRKIAIESYKFDDNPDETTDGISWLFIDYTDITADESGKAEFTQMSTAGYITEFKVVIERGEVREWGPMELYQKNK